jgi:hypothetical protein
MMNQYGKKLKNNYPEEYAVRKIVESFFQMEIMHEEDPRNLEEYMFEILTEADKLMNVTKDAEPSEMAEELEMGEDNTRRNLQFD